MDHVCAVAGGAWRQCAECALRSNGVGPVDVCCAVWNAIRDGRDETTPVVTLMGRYGGEGKPLFFGPLRAIYHVDYAQPTPQPGSYPLLGLETKRVAILDEWTFSEDDLPMATQLAIPEGRRVSECGCCFVRVVAERAAQVPRAKLGPNDLRKIVDNAREHVSESCVSML